MRGVLVLVVVLIVGVVVWRLGGSRSGLPACDAEAGAAAVKGELARMLPKLGERGAYSDIEKRMELADIAEADSGAVRACIASATVTRSTGANTYAIAFEIGWTDSARTKPGWQVMSVRRTSNAESL